MESVDLKIKELLSKNGVAFESIEHPACGSAEEYHNTLHTRYEQQVKALLVQYKGRGFKGFAVVAIQAQKRANLELIKELLNADEIRLADRNQLKDITGCNFGELPPVGSIFNLKLFLDKDLLKEQKVYFNAGKLDFSIALKPISLKEIEKPVMF